jgi:calcineurin-like phosphoesterase family protein
LRSPDGRQVRPPGSPFLPGTLNRKNRFAADSTPERLTRTGFSYADLVLRRPPVKGSAEMRKDVSDKNEVRRYVGKVRAALDDPRLQDVIGRAAAQIPGGGDPRSKVAGLLDQDLDSMASSGGEPEGVPYLSRAPLVSMVQSHVEEALGDTENQVQGQPSSLWARLVADAQRLLHIAPGSFTPDDPDWYVVIAQGVLERLAAGNAPFNAAPAEYDSVADNARLIVVGDWGTGLPRARDVATHMQRQVAEALASGRQVHVLHLGDVYYSGLESEDQRRFLDLWPVTPEQAEAGVTSWSLNGNHDMYSGGFGYFGTLLGDHRFTRQRSPDGKTTSFFRLRSPSWDFVGLDTAWDPDVTSGGQIAVLRDPQASYVARVAAGSPRKLVLFSHHQLVSVYDKSDLGAVLPAKLAPLLDASRVTAWWWGHEHRAITYQAASGVRFPRCLGNGGVPILPDPSPPPGSTPPITWHSTRTVSEDGRKWTRFGFAVLDLQPDRIEVAYIDDDGYVSHTETIT